MSIADALAVADEVSPTPARAVTALKVLRAALSHVGPDSALMAFLEEHVRQVDVEGYAPEHDDEHGDGSLAAAAACYAMHAGGMPWELCEKYWPWEPHTFKPGTPKRDMEKAGGLLVAEWQRVQRAEVASG